MWRIVERIVQVDQRRPQHPILSHRSGKDAVVDSIVSVNSSYTGIPRVKQDARRRRRGRRRRRR
jgi:hypothetical protein